LLHLACEKSKSVKGANKVAKEKDTNLQGEVLQTKGSIQQPWGEMSNEDYIFVEDNLNKIVERLQDKYGGTKEEVLAKIKAIADSEKEE